MAVYQCSVRVIHLSSTLAQCAHVHYLQHAVLQHLCFLYSACSCWMQTLDSCNCRCGKVYGRHSNSLDTNRKVCGMCRARLEPLGRFNVDGTPAKARTASAFSLFVKVHLDNTDTCRAEPRHNSRSKVVCYTQSCMWHVQTNMAQAVTPSLGAHALAGQLCGGEGHGGAKNTAPRGHEGGGGHVEAAEAGSQQHIVVGARGSMKRCCAEMLYYAIGLEAS